MSLRMVEALSRVEREKGWFRVTSHRHCMTSTMAVDASSLLSGHTAV